MWSFNRLLCGPDISWVNPATRVPSFQCLAKSPQLSPLPPVLVAFSSACIRWYWWGAHSKRAVCAVVGVNFEHDSGSSYIERQRWLSDDEGAPRRDWLMPMARYLWALHRTDEILTDKIWVVLLHYLFSRFVETICNDYNLYFHTSCRLRCTYIM